MSYKVFYLKEECNGRRVRVRHKTTTFLTWHAQLGADLSQGNVTDTKTR